MAGLRAALVGAGAAVFGWGWEARRRLYAAGVLRQRHPGARIVSVGNLTAGGTGKTTLTLHLAGRAAAAGMRVAVVCRRYRPGAGGRSDEELLYRAALDPEAVRAGASKLRECRAAVAAGAELVLVDDGFSHWPLARDLDVVLLDAADPWGGGRLLPAGRLREPHRALQRADIVVLSRLRPGEDPEPRLAAVRGYAPAAAVAAGRHRVMGVVDLAGRPRVPGGPARVVTGTGNPAAVAASAAEAGFGPVELARYRDHHWFSPRQAAAELARSAAAGATLVLTAKDAVRWPATAADARVVVLGVAWEWVRGGDAVERRVLGAGR